MCNSLCSVYTLLSRCASLDSSCSVKNDSHIFSPSCCTGYKSYSLYICADLWVLCSPSVYVLLHTKGTFPRPCNLDVCVCVCVCVRAHVLCGLIHYQLAEVYSWSRYQYDAVLSVTAIQWQQAAAWTPSTCPAYDSPCQMGTDMRKNMYMEGDWHWPRPRQFTQ
jgi:hypothetical protein